MKLSKLALLPLLALVLGSCTTQPSSSAGDSSATEPPVSTETSNVETETVPPATTETVPPAPVIPTAWTSEQEATIKGALGGNTLPFFYYEGGELTSETVTEGTLTLTLLKYELVNAPETAQDELLKLFRTDGYIDNTEASTETTYVLNKIFRVYLNEQIIMTLASGVTPLQKPYITMEWVYICGEVNNDWSKLSLTDDKGKAHSLDELLEAIGAIGTLPAPTFAFDHAEIYAFNPKEKFITIGLFTGDLTPNYLANLALAGYTCDGVTLKDGTDAFLAVNDIFKLQVIMYYEPEIDGIFIQASWIPTETWYPGYISRAIEKVTGLKKVALTEPTTVPVDDYTVTPYPLDAEGTKLGCAIVLSSTEPEAANAYISDLIEDGYFIARVPGADDKSTALVDPFTLAEVIVTPYDAETGTFLVKVPGKLAAADPTTVELLQQTVGATINDGLYIEEEYVWPADALSLDIIDAGVVEEEMFGEVIETVVSFTVAFVYEDPEAAAAAYLKAFKDANLQVVETEFEDFGRFRARSGAYGVEYSVDTIPAAHLLVVKVQSVLTADYDIYAPYESIFDQDQLTFLTATLGDYETLFPLPEEITDKAVAEVMYEPSERALAIIYGSGASFSPVTKEGYDAWTAALLEAGWVAGESETDPETGATAAVFNYEVGEVKAQIVVEYAPNVVFSVMIINTAPVPELPATMAGNTYEGADGWDESITYTVVVTDAETITVNGVAATDIVLLNVEGTVEIHFNIEGESYYIYEPSEGAIVLVGPTGGQSFLMKAVAEDTTAPATNA